MAVSSRQTTLNFSGSASNSQDGMSSSARINRSVQGSAHGLHACAFARCYHLLTVVLRSPCFLLRLASRSACDIPLSFYVPTSSISLSLSIGLHSSPFRLRCADPHLQIDHEIRAADRYPNVTARTSSLRAHLTARSEERAHTSARAHLSARTPQRAHTSPRAHLTARTYSIIPYIRASYIVTFVALSFRTALLAKES
jgi:hypothetical protein